MMPYMDAARVGKWRVRAGIEVRLQSYIRPTSAEYRFRVALMKSAEGSLI
jgi:hypothetical protein